MQQQPELVDNLDGNTHEAALRWLAEHRSTPSAIATGYVNVAGLFGLAEVLGESPRPTRLLIGATPEPGLGERSDSNRIVIRERLQRSLDALSHDRDFRNFPPERRAVLERVHAFLKESNVEVCRYQERFLHGKAYLFGRRGPGGGLEGEGAVLVSSANLTGPGLIGNLELGLADYSPSRVEMSLDWFDRLWSDGVDFKDQLIDLIAPRIDPTDPQTVFLRALLELYGDELPAPEEATRLSERLTRFQRDGYLRAERILDLYDGVLYADGVGTGKTEIGLRFVEEYARDRGLHTLIVAPAQLRDRHWERRLRELLLPGEVLSYQQLASDRQLTGNPTDPANLAVDKDTYRLVIVDEGHAFRNTGTNWYKAMDRLLGGAPKKIVLLTATPVNNTLWDLHNLALLFGRHDGFMASAGPRIPSLRKFFRDAGANDPENISETKLFPMVDAIAVRRDRRFLEENYADDTFPDGTPVRFPRPELIEQRYDLDEHYPGLVQRVAHAMDDLTMARYLVSSYLKDSPRTALNEVTLAGLVRSGLLKRFESCWEAALGTSQRMLAANEVVIHGITTLGAMPTGDELRNIARDAVEGEAIEDLMESVVFESSVQDADLTDAFLVDVRKDVANLRMIVESLEQLASAPDPKLELLQEILVKTRATKVAVFCSFGDTARYLRRKMDETPGLLGDREVSVVIGDEDDANSRQRELERFCPESVTEIPGYIPQNGEVDLLISTDVLSEGQNLQDAQAVISYDMPWNPQRVVQRNGRVIRLKSKHRSVFLYTMLPEAGDLEDVLKLEARIRSKVFAASAALGMETPVLAAIEAESKVFADLESFAERLASGDASLLDEADSAGEGSFAGELFRSMLMRALIEGEVSRLEQLPWGVHSCFVQPENPRGPRLDEPGVFFSCRSADGRKFRRFVMVNGQVLDEDLTMLRLIDPIEEMQKEIPDSIDTAALFEIAATSICEANNAEAETTDPGERLPASQRWALGILRSPELAIADPRFDRADEALGAARGAGVKRALSEIRRQVNESEIAVHEAAEEIVAVVEQFGLRAPGRVELPPTLVPEDLGVVCYQVVLPRS